MAKNDNLKDFLTDVADAIREKKGSTDLINPQDFSSEIASIQSGDIWGFDTIGYTPQNSTIDDIVNYSLKIKEDIANGKKSFGGDYRLVFFPNVDFSQIKTDSMNMFSACYSLIYLPSIDAINMTRMQGTFNLCSALQELHIRNTYNSWTFSNCFYGCTSLRKVDYLDWINVTAASFTFSNCTSLVFALMENIGKSTLTTYDFSGALIWGTGSEENRQSLIDSLITYSYDRASNGMSTVTIKLSANTKALLTEEEIAQITNKGFTIS
jgi:hypothetical protein